MPDPIPCRRCKRAESGEPDDFILGIGRRLLMLRKEAGLSLDQLAANTDLSKTGLWEIEKGRSEPGARRLLRLSIALRCTVDFLLRGDECNP